MHVKPMVKNLILGQIVKHKLVGGGQNYVLRLMFQSKGKSNLIGDPPYPLTDELGQDYVSDNNQM